jgi:excinuclease ABC subunit C
MFGMERLSNNLKLKEKIRQAPLLPGCYLFADKHGNIIYVGKAKNLQNRVKSYFTAAASENWRTADLVPRIDDIE